MSPIKFFQKWWQQMARKRRPKAFEPMRDMPTVEFIPVQEGKEEFEKRVQEVREILARMYVNARKRGRPTKDEWEESHAA
jgi:hypothetical protein